MMFSRCRGPASTPCLPSQLLPNTLCVCQVAKLGPWGGREQQGGDPGHSRHCCVGL